MGKGNRKELNPADAERKKQRKKELKKVSLPVLSFL
jgi:hypothetical protein